MATKKKSDALKDEFGQILKKREEQQKDLSALLKDNPYSNAGSKAAVSASTTESNQKISADQVKRLQDMAMPNYSANGSNMSSNVGASAPTYTAQNPLIGSPEWVQQQNGNAYNPAEWLAKEPEQGTAAWVEWNKQRTEAQQVSQDNLTGYSKRIEAAKAQAEKEQKAYAAAEKLASGLSSADKDAWREYLQAEAQLKKYYNINGNNGVFSSGVDVKEEVQATEKRVADLKSKVEEIKARLRDENGVDKNQLNDLNIYFQNTIDERRRYQEQKANVAEADANGVTSSLKTVPASLIGGTISGADLAAQYINRKVSGSNMPLSTSTEAQSTSNYSRDVRGRVAENIAGDGTSALRNFGSFAYQTGMSGLDSAAAASTGFGGVLLGIGAGAQAMQDSIEKGVSADQAIAYGLAAGIFEGLFETWSIGKWADKFEKGIVNNRKQFIINLLVSSGVNFSEELNTQVADDIADYLINADKSQLMQTYNAAYKMALENGATEAEAKEFANQEAAKWFAKDILAAGAGGALMGLGFGLAGNVRGMYNAHSNAVDPWVGPKQITDKDKQQQAIDATKKQSDMVRRAGIIDSLTQKIAQAESEKMGGAEHAPAADQEKAAPALPGSPNDIVNGIVDRIKNGQPVTKNDIKTIRNNKADVARALGVDADKIGNTKAEIRNAIKAYQEGQQTALPQSISEEAPTAEAAPEQAQELEGMPIEEAEKYLTDDERNAGVRIALNEDGSAMLDETGGPAKMRKVNAAEFRLMQEIAAVFGRRITEDSIADDLPDGTWGSYNVDTGEIRINRNQQLRNGDIRKTWAVSTLIHEMLHSAESRDGKKVQAYEDLKKHFKNSDAFRSMKRNRMAGDYDTLIAIKAKEYGTTDMDLAERELIAEYAEQYLFQDEESIRELCGKNRGLAQTIKNFADELLAFLGNSKAQIAVEIRQAQKYYAKALAESEGRETEKRNKAAEEGASGEEGQTQFSTARRKGKSVTIGEIANSETADGSATMQQKGGDGNVERSGLFDRSSEKKEPSGRLYRYDAGGRDGESRDSLSEHSIRSNNNRQDALAKGVGFGAIQSSSKKGLHRIDGNSQTWQISDERYAELAEKDTKAAENILEEKARQKGYTKHLFHGTDRVFSIFKINEQGIHVGTREQALQRMNLKYDRNKYTHYSLLKIIAEANSFKYPTQLASIVKSVEIGLDEDYGIDFPFTGDEFSADDVVSYCEQAAAKLMDKGHDYSKFSVQAPQSGIIKTLISAYVKTGNEMHVPFDLGTWDVYQISSMLIAKLDGKEYKQGPNKTFNTSLIDGIELTEADRAVLQDFKTRRHNDFEGFAKWLNDKGINSIRYNNTYEGNKNSDSYLLLDPRQIKSTHVTYDEKGKLIPLSKRFDAKNPDIRYSKGALRNAQRAASHVSLTASEDSAAITYTEDGQVLTMKNPDNGRLMFNEATWKNGGEKLLQGKLEEMVKAGQVSEKDAADMITEMQYWFEKSQEIRKGNPALVGYGQWAIQEIVLDANNNISLHCIVKNSEYAMNIDFSTVCKKRAALNQVLNELVKSGEFRSILQTAEDTTGELRPEDVATINEAIREHGFEVACQMCFVDAKRYAIDNWARTFTEPYNKLVRAFLGEGVYNGEMNFSGAEGRRAANGAKQDSYEAGVKRMEELLHTKEFLDDKDKPKGIYVRMSKLIAGYKTNGKAKTVGKFNKKIADRAAMELNPNDLISSIGMDGMKKDFPELYEVLKPHQGTAKPKTAHSETPYNGEILLGNINDAKFNWRKAFSMGGVRMQSFSDFRANMWFDYIQAITELQAKSCCAQAYTKEAAFAKLYGKTGIKINMSLLCRVDGSDLKALKALSEKELDAIRTGKKSNAEVSAMLRRVGLNPDGTYCWATEIKDSKGKIVEANETFNPDEAFRIQANDEYGRNCGTIVVGLSYEHVMKMLSDPNIRMVIPYHKSGMNHLVAIKTNTHLFTDFTSFQSETDSVTGKKLSKEEGGKRKVDFYTILGNNTKSAYGMKLVMGGDLQANLDAVIRKTEVDFVRECEEKGLRPRFPQFAYIITDGSTTVKYNENGKPTNVLMGEDGKPAVREGYYKCLEDYSLKDNHGHYTGYEHHLAEAGDRTNAEKEANAKDPTKGKKRVFTQYAAQDTVKLQLPKTIVAGPELASLGLEGKKMSTQDYIAAILKDQQTTQDKLDADMKALTDDILERLGSTAERENHRKYDLGLDSITMQRARAKRQAQNQMLPDVMLSKGAVRGASQQDAEYMEAVKHGDKAKAKKLVEEAARKAGYTIMAYHGTNNKFNTFTEHYATGWGKGIYLTDSKAGAGEYGKNIIEGFVKLEKPYTGNGLGNEAKSTKAYKEYCEQYWRQMAEEEGATIEEVKEWYPAPTVDEMVGDEEAKWLNSALRELGYDGIAVKGSNDIDGMEYVLFSPEQVKSADPVTYDDHGDVIPLDKRFDRGQKDIRYSKGAKRGAARTYTEVRKAAYEDMSKLPKAASDIASQTISRSYYQGNTAFMSQKRMNAVYDDYGHRTSYIAYIDPLDFISLTTSNVDAFLERNKNGLNEGKSETWGVPNNIEESGPLFLLVDETGHVVGHEGRHRMAALHRAGIEKAAIPIIFVDGKAADSPVVDKGPISATKLLGQDFGEGIRSYSSVFLHRLMPITEQYRNINDAAYAYRDRALDRGDVQYSKGLKNNSGTTDTRAIVQAQQAAIQRGIKDKSRQPDTKAQDLVDAAVAFARADQQQADDIHYAGEMARHQRKSELDKAKALAAKQRELDYQKQLTDNANARTAAARAKGVADTAAAKAAGQAKVEGIKETARKRKLRESIKTSTKWFTDRVGKPTNSKHVPVEIIESAAEVAELMAMETASAGDLAGTTKASERLSKLLRRIEKAAEGKTNDASAQWTYGIQEMVKNLRDSLEDSGHTVADMTEEELLYTDQVLKALIKNINQAGYLIKEGKQVEISKASDDAAYEVMRTKGVDGGGQLLAWKGFTDILTPKSFIDMISGYQHGTLDSLRKALNEGQRKAYSIQQEAAKLFENVTGKGNARAMKDFVDYKKGVTNLGLLDGNGNEVTITHAQLCSLWMHLSSEQNLDHVAWGGLTLPNPVYAAKGNQAEAMAKSIRVEVQDITKLQQKVYEAMTDYDWRWVQDSRGFFNDFCQKHINETSLQLLGFEKANVENYFPINTDKTYSERTFDQIVRDGSIEGQGWLKERVEGSKNPINLYGIDQVVKTQVEGVSTYAGLAIPVRNFQNVYNYHGRGEYGTTLRYAIGHKWGSAAERYIGNWLGDIQGNSRHHAEGLEAVFGRFRGNYAQAVLTMNPKSALAQVSLYSAAPVLGSKAVLRATADLVNVSTIGGRNRALDKLNAEMAEHTPMGWIRKKGSTAELYDMRQGDSLASRILTGTFTIGGKELDMNKLSGWISRMDENTISAIWQAAKYSAADQGLNESDSEYWPTVTELFNRAVEETQPNYTPMQMTQVARNKDEFSKTFSMFKSPFMSTANTWISSFGEWQAKSKSNTATAEEKRQAFDTFKTACGAQVLQAVLSAALGTLANGIFFHKWDDDRDEEGNVTALATIQNIMYTAIGNLVNQHIPVLAGDVFDAVGSALTGKYYYGGLGTSGLSTLNDALSDINTLLSKGASPKTVMNAVTHLCTMIGLPANAVKNWYKGISAWADGAAKGNLLNGGFEYSNANTTASIQKAMNHDANVDYAQRAVDHWLESWKRKNATGDAKSARSALRTALTQKYKNKYINADASEKQKIKKVLLGIRVDGLTIYEAKDIDGWK